jgi:hypothetical protein
LGKVGGHCCGWFRRHGGVVGCWELVRGLA